MDETDRKRWKNLIAYDFQRSAEDEHKADAAEARGDHSLALKLRTAAARRRQEAEVQLECYNRGGAHA